MFKLKRLIAILLCLAFLGTTLPFASIPTKAEDGYHYYKNFKYTVSNGEATIYAMDTMLSGNVIIPETVNGYPVKHIGSDAFEYCESLSSVIIPEGVVTIGKDAFSCCRLLRSVSIPSTVTSIGLSAFAYCSSLSAVSIPEGVTTIEINTFMCCENLTSVVIPSTVTSIKNSAFSTCYNLAEITIPNSVIVIEDYAFQSCYPSQVYYLGTEEQWKSTLIGIDNDGLLNAEFSFFALLDGFLIAYTVSNEEATITKCSSTFTGNIILPETLDGYPVVSIGSTALKGLKITGVVVPDTVTSIGESAFNGCTQLKRIFLSDNLISIGSTAFRDCDSLISLTLPNSLTFLGDNAFYSCDNLKSVNIPEKITAIEEGTFRFCGALTSITIPNSVTSIGDRAFMGCLSLTGIRIPSSVTSIDDSAFFGCDSLINISIPYNVTYLGPSAFSNCKSLEKITIPDSITTIERSTFYNCPSLTSITIPDSVTSIGDSAFYNCTSLTNITIPDGIPTIERSTFYNCTSLTNITIPDSVTSIGEFAFYSCDSLTSITIPQNVKNIHQNAFNACKSLKNIYVDEQNSSFESLNGILFNKKTKTLVRYPCGKTDSSYSVPEVVSVIGSCAFHDCDNLTSITIADGVKTIDSSAFYSCSNLTNVYIPDSVYYINTSAFSNCINLISIKIPNNVKSIGYSAFYSCSKLTDINIPNKVTVIYNQAFEGCSNLKSITIPESVVTIGSKAFNSCTSLTEVYSPSLDAWCNIAFADQYANPLSNGGTLYIDGEAPVNITIPSEVTSIGNYAFYGCKQLTSAVIFEEVTSIGTKAFYNCPNLTIRTPESSYTYSYAVSNNIPVKVLKLGDILETPIDTSGFEFISYGTGTRLSDVDAGFTDGYFIAKKDGYNTFIISEELYNAEALKKITLIPSNSNSHISAVHTNGKDFIANHFVTENNQTDTVNVTVYPANDIAVSRYQLMFGNEVIKESFNGQFAINPNEAPTGGSFYVRLIDTRGRVYSKIKLSYENKPFIEVDFELDDIVNFTIPSDVPLIGGGKVNLKLDGLPINFKVSGDSLFVAIGTEYDFGDKEFNFLTYRKFVTDVGRGLSLYEAARSVGGIGALKLWNGAAGVGFNTEVKANAVGYCEIQRDSNGDPVIKSSMLVITVSGKFGAEYQTYIAVVPIVIKIECEAEAKATLTFGLADDNTAHFGGRMELTLPKITASAGVGLKKIANLSVYGSASNVISINFTTDRTTAALEGEVGISAKVLFWKKKRTLIKGTYPYYDSATRAAVASYAMRSAPQNTAAIPGDISEDTGYLLDRSHLSTQSAWLSSPKAQTYSLLRNRSFNVSEFNTLQTDIYTDAAPRIASLPDGRILMVWTADIAERSDYNHTAAVYSVYDPALSYWSEPQIISDDSTADFYPQIATDGDNTYVVWCNSNTVFNSEVEIEALAATCEISYARFNSNLSTFEGVTDITNDGYYDSKPAVFVNGGRCYVAWVKNTANAPLTMEGSNKIYYCALGGNATLAAEQSCPVTELKIGLLGDDPVISYVTDTDGDFATTEDSIIYAATVGSSPSVLSGAASQGNIVLGKIGGENKLLWHKDGKLVAIDSLSSSTETLIDNFAATVFEIASSNTMSAVLYSMPDLESDSDNAALFACLYGENGFSEPVRINRNEDAFVEGANGYIDENGNLRIIYTENTVEFEGEDFTEHASLVAATVISSYDVEVKGINYDEEATNEDGNMTVSVNVKNNSFFELSSLTATVTDKNGNTVFTTPINKSLGIGEEKELSFEFPIPAIKTVTEYTVSIYPNGGNDINTENNTADIEIGYSCISVEIEKTVSGNAQGALLTVKNNGIKTENLTLYIYENDTDGALLGIYTLGSIKAGATAVFDYAPQKLRFLSAESDILCFEIVSSSEEKYAGDNYGHITYKTVMLELNDGSLIEYYFDANDDGTFDIRDLVRIKKLLAESTDQHADRDVTGDEALDSLDTVAVKRKLLLCA